MKYYVVDAFSDRPFHGNPAGVCVLDQPLPTETMQAIAAENNLSETAFVLKNNDFFDLRWFTPAMEIDLCGHATLGSAFVLFSFFETDQKLLSFHTQSGLLTVAKRGDLLEMDFPVREQLETPVADAMEKTVNKKIISAHRGYNLQLELENEEAVRSAIPKIEAIRALEEYHAVIITAKGEDVDFVSRFFGPNVGVNEDPVTGSAHTSLVPYWAGRLQKNTLTARQLSKRGGMLWCELKGGRVLISGKAYLYLKGEIFR